MKQIEECVNALIEKVLESEDYRHYQEMQKKVNEDPAKAQAINEFRYRLYQLQNERKDVDLFEEIGRLEHEKAEFRAEPLVEEYLAAELAMCRLVQRINWKLMESLDFDMGHWSRF